MVVSMDICVMDCNGRSESLLKRQRQKSKESVIWVSDDDQLGQLVSDPADTKALDQALSEDIQRHPRYATKAATAAKRLQAVAASGDASRPRCLPANPSVLGIGGCAVGEAAAATTVIAGAPTVDPSAQHTAPATGILAPCNTATAEPKALVATITATVAPGAARCTAGRDRLPGLRTLNGLRLPGPATALGQRTAVPLLLASSRGRPSEIQGAAAGATSGHGQAFRLAPVPVPGCALRGLHPDESAGWRPGPAPPRARSPGAFLPPPVQRLPNLARRQQLADAGAPGDSGGHGAGGNASSDGACNRDAADRGAAARKAAPPSAGDRGQCRGAGRGSGSGGSASGRLTNSRGLGGGMSLVVQQHGRCDDINAELSACDGGDDSDGGVGDDAGMSSYSSCPSYSSYGSGRSYGSALEDESADADDESEGRKRRRVARTGAAVAIAQDGTGIAAVTIATAAGSGTVCGAPAGPPVGDGKQAVAPAGAAARPAGGCAATAAGGAGGRRSGIKQYYCYGPPWPLVPRAGRPGMLRFNTSVARALWPTLLEAAAEDGQLVTLHIEVPASGCAGDDDKQEEPNGHGATAAAVTTVPVRALLRQYDDTGMTLRVVDAWPLAHGISPNTLLQISPLNPAGDGALVQVANRHVWAYYRARGGKLCCPDAAFTGADDGVAPSLGFDDGGVLQLRLGTNLFDNRSFDVGVRAAERLFGHLMVRPQGCGGGLGAAGGDGGAAVAAAVATGVPAGDDGKDGAGRGVAAAAGADGGVTESKDGGAAAAAVAPLPIQLVPIQSLPITVMAEAWPETRFQVEFRYRFPRMYGLANNARHAYATLASTLAEPMMLCGAQPGDVFEMWRRPGAATDDFMCRVARSEPNGSGRRVIVGKRGSGAAGGMRSGRGAVASAAAAVAAVTAVAAAAAAAVEGRGAAAVPSV